MAKIIELKKRKKKNDWSWLSWKLSFSKSDRIDEKRVKEEVYIKFEDLS